MSNHQLSRPRIKSRYSLFLKIMGVFWITLILTTIANITITAQISNIEHKAEKIQSKIESLANDGVTVFETSGEKALNKWYQRIYKDNEIRAVLYRISTEDSIQKREKLGQPVSHRRHQVKGKEKQQQPHTIKERDNHKFLKRVNATRPPFKTHIAVTSPNGDRYLLKLLPSPYIHKELGSPNEYRWLRLLITLGIILMASLWLSRHVVRPVTTLKQASQKMAAGELSTRVGSDVGNRKDELGQLAVSFDEMAEQLEKTITGQKQLLRDISHEIRTPLTRQRIAIDLIKTMVDNTPDALQMLDKIESQNNKLNELIENLLTLNRLNDGATPLATEPVDLASLLKELIDDADIEASTKKITLIQQGLTSATVNGNRLLLARAFENIVGNTLKYSPDNAIVSVDISTADNGIIIDIADQGPGLSKEEIQQVFTPFYRADNSRTQTTGGYGLGLAIVKKVIDLHKGKVKLFTPAEGGLCVRVYIPSPAAQSLS